MWTRRNATAALAVAAGFAFGRLPVTGHSEESVSQNAARLSRFHTPDGRVLEYFIAGPEHGTLVVCHHGTPYTALGYLPWEDDAAAAGMRVLAYSRPGYGVSTRLHGRDVAQAAGDVALLLDHLDVDQFVTAGWSGGGPHALACGALLPDRCKAVATLAGVGAWGYSDLDFLNGMGPENVAEFGAALDGEEALADFLSDDYSDFHKVTAQEIAESLGGLVSEPDKAALTAAFAENVAESFRWSLHSGFGGWVDDDLAFVRQWGFSLGDMRVPVTIWQGQQDYMVPSAHGRWLAKHIPNARFRFEPEQGHLTLVASYVPAILADLASRSGT